MLSMLSVALLSGIASLDPTEHVDMLELNHYYDAKGNLAFDQVIYWGRNRTSGCPEVRAWRMASDSDLHNRRPVKSEATGLWVSEWTESGKRYRIVSRQYHESWTQIDREAEDKKRLPDERRKGLSAVIAPAAEQ